MTSYLIVKVHRAARLWLMALELDNDYDVILCVINVI